MSLVVGEKGAAYAHRRYAHTHRRRRATRCRPAVNSRTAMCVPADSLGLVSVAEAVGRATYSVLLMVVVMGSERGERREGERREGRVVWW